jgi:hypothetical protein
VRIVDILLVQAGLVLQLVLKHAEHLVKVILIVEEGLATLVLVLVLTVGHSEWP